MAYEDIVRRPVGGRVAQQLEDVEIVNVLRRIDVCEPRVEVLVYLGHADAHDGGDGHERSWRIEAAHDSRAAHTFT